MSPRNQPRVVYVVVDDFGNPVAVYGTRVAAKINTPFWGTIVPYVPRKPKAKK